MKKLFQELRDEELAHQALVREAMRNLPPTGPARTRPTTRTSRSATEAGGPAPPPAQLSGILQPETAIQSRKLADAIGRPMW